MDTLVDALARSGPVGILAGGLLLLNALLSLWLKQLYRDLRSESKARHEDEQRYLNTALQLQTRIHETVDRLERLETARLLKGRQ